MPRKRFVKVKHVIHIDPIQLEQRVAQIEAQRNKEREEQEKRDLEIAIRVSKEMTQCNINRQCIDLPPQHQRTELAGVPPVAQSEQTYDLSRWKYSELRDVINTSCDPKLLTACRQEFQRRLKAYHAWKSTRNAHTPEVVARVDQGRTRSQATIYAPSAPSLSLMSEDPANQHRYFGIPFLCADGTEDTKGRSWWYAHFDGQYVVRQMELHADKMPVLLQAGADSSGTQICKLSLDSTGLTRRPGAEISEYEFERLWTHYGGPPPYPH